MRITFAVAAFLLVAALAIATGSQTFPAARVFPGAVRS
jgi:hypothetical protein